METRVERPDERVGCRMGDAAYVVGIDLGTSNCALAFASAHFPEGGIHDFQVEQLDQYGQVGARVLLPSFLFSVPEHERGLVETGMMLEGFVAGQFARRQAAKVPGRVVSSAKSWLCHAGVDRQAPILPWASAADVKKISPVQASTLILQHLKNSWNRVHPEHLLEHQDVVITVPASFDQVARTLTVQSIQEAGLTRFRLLEEPQAAFYHFVFRNEKKLKEALDQVRLVLVADVGGGTTDFTLVQVVPGGATVELGRVAVGEHLMLGGDNMDAALARFLEQQWPGKKLSANEWIQLTQAAREAKENLFQNRALTDFPITLAREGSRLIGNTLSARVGREQMEQILLAGFFPEVNSGDGVARTNRVGIQELGLPYHSEPAITRHLVEFLRTHGEVGFEALGQQGAKGFIPRPDAVLFNGGVFNSESLRQRFLEVLSALWPDRAPVKTLDHETLDLAVSRGAAYYGLVRLGAGKKIQSGASTSFYIGLGIGAKPDSEKFLCVMPRGTEEGSSLEISDKNFQVVVGKPVQFPLYSAVGDTIHRAGTVIVPELKDFRQMPPIQTILKGDPRSGTVPVHLRSRLTEVGTLEIWCVANDQKREWKLEFELRKEEPQTGLTVTESLPGRFSEARAAIQHVFGKMTLVPGKEIPADFVPPKDVRQLWAFLERTLGSRETWRVGMLRAIWSEMDPLAPRRRRSPENEKVFLQLWGYCLRPGFGFPLDDWRVERTFRIFSELVESHREKPVWNEFWILWRRVSGGLKPEQQETIWSYLRPHIFSKYAPTTAKTAVKPKGIQPDGFEEMVRATASMEHLAVAAKEELGLLLSNLVGGKRPGPWPWSLGRLGARAPIYGGIHSVVPPRAVESWIEELKKPENLKLDGAAFALSQMGRLTMDRSRDLSDEKRAEVLHALESVSAPQEWRRFLAEVVTAGSVDENRMLGDSLPAGLVLST